MISHIAGEKLKTHVGQKENNRNLPRKNSISVNGKTLTPKNIATMMLLTEDELAQIADTRNLLKSRGDYGCDCLVYEGDVTAEGYWLDDNSFRELQRQAGNRDIGTVAVLGNLAVNGKFLLSDRLMCLFVTGTVQAAEFASYETEVYIGGDLRTSGFSGQKSRVTVAGTIAEEH